MKMTEQDLRILITEQIKLTGCHGGSCPIPSSIECSNCFFGTTDCKCMINIVRLGCIEKQECLDVRPVLRKIKFSNDQSRHGVWDWYNGNYNVAEKLELI